MKTTLIRFGCLLLLRKLGGFFYDELTEEEPSLFKMYAELFSRLISK